MKKNIVDFNKYINTFDNYRDADYELIDVMIKKLNLQQANNILDYGCGTGNYLRGFKKLGFYNFFGIDKSSEMCKMASEKTGFNVKVGDEHSILFENKKFDAIILIDVIHFIENISVLLCSLKKGGHIFIATQSFEQLENRIYAKYFPSAEVIDKSRHHRIDKIINESKDIGLSVKEVIGYKVDTDFIVDKNYYNLIKSKAFYILGLIPQEEFNEGIGILDEELKNGSFVAKFPGRTLIILENE